MAHLVLLLTGQGLRLSVRQYVVDFLNGHRGEFIGSQEVFFGDSQFAIGRSFIVHAQVMVLESFVTVFSLQKLVSKLKVFIWNVHSFF